MDEQTREKSRDLHVRNLPKPVIYSPSAWRGMSNKSSHQQDSHKSAHIRNTTNPTPVRNGQNQDGSLSLVLGLTGIY